MQSFTHIVPAVVEQYNMKLTKGKQCSVAVTVLWWSKQHTSSIFTMRQRRLLWP